MLRNQVGLLIFFMLSYVRIERALCTGAFVFHLRMVEAHSWAPPCSVLSLLFLADAAIADDLAKIIPVDKRQV